MSTFYAIDPSSEVPFAELPETTADQVAEMVADAQRALAVEHEWRTPRVRSRVLARIARRVEAQAAELAELETRDTGAPLSRARAEVQAAARCFDDCAGSIERLEGRQIPRGPQLLEYTVREPWGVCAQIVSWRHPLHVTARHAAPALAAGNAVIVKPSELASIAPLRLAELAEEAGVPRGMIQVATGPGAVGAALAEHPRVDHVTFAGSAATGALVAAACARRLAPLELELAGNALAVVFADADLAAAVPAVVQSGLTGARLLIERSVHDDVVARVTAALEALTIGPGAEDPDVGPLISARRLQRAIELLAGGATIVTGGEATGGLFLQPTLVTGVQPHVELVGPVVAALPFAEEREAVALANATPHSPVARVWTRDLARAHRVAAGIRAGQVLVNARGRGDGVDALPAYSRLKRVTLDVRELRLDER